MDASVQYIAPNGSLDFYSSVSSSVLNLYNRLPAGCKPRHQNNNSAASTEFTVLAGIVARTGEAPNYSYTCLTAATGTKCIPAADEANSQGELLSDSHAEILARRAFIRYLLETMMVILQDGGYSTQPSCPLLLDQEHLQFTLKPNWTFHLYISDSPCGDASIYPLTSHDGDIVRGFTGAKAVQDNQSLELVREDKVDQCVGQVRIKSGRSDIDNAHRTAAMSCSDKICKWIVLGLQGSLIRLLLRDRIPLASITVGLNTRAVGALSEDFTTNAQFQALKRAVVDRCSDVFGSIPSVRRVDTELFIEGHAGRQFEASLSKVKLSIIAKDSSRDSSVKDDQSGGLSEEDLKVGLVPAAKRRKLDEKACQPCGCSVNWILKPSIGNLQTLVKKVDNGDSKRFIAGGIFEVTNAQNGLLQGMTIKSLKKRLDEAHQIDKEMTRPSAEPFSRLCRRSLGKLFANVTLRLVKSHRSQELPELQRLLAAKPYSWWKAQETLPLGAKKVSDCSNNDSNIEEKYQYAKEAFYRHSRFSAWIRSESDKQVGDTLPLVPVATTSSTSGSSSSL